MTGSHYILVAKTTLNPGSLYFPRWNGKKWDDRLDMARVYATEAGADSEAFMAACADPRVVGYIEIVAVKAGSLGPAVGP